MKSPSIIAHRGASYDAPENTIASFKLAVEQNADGIELDIHLSADKEIVVIHDSTFERTTGETGSVAMTEWTTIKQKDAGEWKGSSFQGERIPLLKEALGVPVGKRVWFIEIKSDQEMIPHLKKVLKAAQVSNSQIILISFDYEALKEAKKEMPEMKALLLKGRKENQEGDVNKELEELIQLAKKANFDGLNLGKFWPIDSAFVERIHRENLLLSVWTVNDVPLAIKLRDAGVDAITTDRPGLIREALKIE